MTYLNLLILTALICFIEDVSGFVQSIKKIVVKRMTGTTLADPSFVSVKPFDCSLCMTWWTGIAYLLICKELTIINLGYVGMLSLFSSNISEFELLAKDYLASFQGWLQKLISHK